MNKFNWMKKSDGCKKSCGNHPRATLITHPPPQSVTPFFLTVPGITLDIIKGVCLKRPKDFDNNKNFYAQPYPSVQGVKGRT